MKPYNDVLVLSLDPYKFATRTRKAANSYAEVVRTRFLSLSGAGRTGRWDTEGVRASGNLTIEQVRTRPVKTSPTKTAAIHNLIISYIPALFRLLLKTLLRPARIVHVTGAPLAPIAYLHKFIHRSILVLDINERPAAVTAKGSLFSLTARIEPLILNVGSSLADITLVVSPGHAQVLKRRFRFKDVEVVRNCPENDWRPHFIPPPRRPPGTPLKVATVGTLFEGRALELTIEAARILRARDCPVQITIAGPGRPDYVAKLRAQIAENDLKHLVTLRGPVAREAVSAVYADAHVGLALYEPTDSGNDSLSNKIIESVCAGRPVLASRLPENESFINSFGVGWLTDVSSASIADALSKIAQDYPNGLAERCYSIGQSTLNWAVAFEPTRDAALARGGL